ncbi:MAG: class I SAM-dependent methyltransferase [Candidatus Diapherotrites archaeon]|nr:class I SAM-dependent methyltransferase [Candidatus Diapherotrites archaeon]
MLKNFFSKPFFEIWLEQADGEIKDWFQKEICYLEENIKPKAKILDVGCGFGRHIEILANSSKEVIGVDINPAMIQRAKKTIGIQKRKATCNGCKEAGF